MPGVLKPERAINEYDDSTLNFDSVLDLEEDFFKEGFALGEADGQRAGRAEGRLFGLEKGFEKFAEVATLQGQSLIIAARLGKSSSSTSQPAPSKQEAEIQASPPQAGLRLQKHVSTLEALTDLDSLSIENNEESVSELDDRLKRAHAKLKIIRRLIGDGSAEEERSKPATKGGNGIEDFNTTGARR